MTAELSKVNWSDLAIGLYEKLNERHAEISYEFHDFELQIPNDTGAESSRATWVTNGTLKISTSEAQ